MADRRRLRRITDRLAAEYGRPVLRPHGAPVDELVLTVLSQNTNDRNRDVAYSRLRERFPSWDAVREAPVEEIEDAIRPGGLAPTKSVRIKQILEAIGDDDLPGSPTRPWTRRARTCARCPAWAARRPPACCCSRSGAPTCRSTRTCTASAARLGLWPEKAPLDEAHDELARAVRRRRRVRLRDPRAADPPRPAHLRGPRAALRRVPAAAHVPRGPAAAGPRMSEDTLRRGAEAGPDRHRRRLGADVRDGSGRHRASCPSMAFLAYRFLPAALIVAVIFWRPLRAAARGGLARRSSDGLVPLAPATSSRRSASSRPRRPTPASSPACSWCSRPCWARSSCATTSPAVGVGCRRACRRSACACSREPAADFDLRGDGLVLLCAFVARRPHPRYRARGAALRRRERCWRSSSASCGRHAAWRSRPSPASSRRPRGRPCGRRCS